MRRPSRQGAFFRRDILEISSMTGMRLIAGRPLSVLAALSLMAGVCTIAQADDALVDTRTVPRLDGAVNDPARTTDMSSQYSVPGNMERTAVAIRQLMSANGWVFYDAPEKEPRGLE